MTLLTIGHSTHTVDRFTEIARAARLDVLIDVRSHRTSKWPWWHEAEIRRWTADAGLGYETRPELGGWDERHVRAGMAEWAEARGVKLSAYARGYFPKQRIGVGKRSRTDDPTLDSGWTNQGLHDYSWYTATSEFQDGIDRLIADYGSVDQPRAAFFCSEFLWWKCHRSMIADCLTVRGFAVGNLTPRTRDVKVEVHQLRDRLDRYAPGTVLAWARAGVQP